MDLSIPTINLHSSNESMAYESKPSTETTIQKVMNTIIDFFSWVGETFDQAMSEFIENNFDLYRPLSDDIQFPKRTKSPVDSDTGTQDSETQKQSKIEKDRCLKMLETADMRFSDFL